MGGYLFLKEGYKMAKIALIVAVLALGATIGLAIRYKAHLEIPDAPVVESINHII